MQKFLLIIIIIIITIIIFNDDDDYDDDDDVKRFNIIIDVLGGWSVDLKETMKDLVGQRPRSMLRRMQEIASFTKFEQCPYFYNIDLILRLL